MFPTMSRVLLLLKVLRDLRLLSLSFLKDFSTPLRPLTTLPRLPLKPLMKPHTHSLQGIKKNRKLFVQTVVRQNHYYKQESSRQIPQAFLLSRVVSLEIADFRLLRKAKTPQYICLLVKSLYLFLNNSFDNQ